MTAYKKNLQVIQMLRGIACLLVILLHVTVTYNETFHVYFLNGIFRFGGSGVDIFFVLSGFIITYSHQFQLNKSHNAVPFLKKRFVRIFPIYWLIISLLLLLQILLPSFYRSHYRLNFYNLLNTYFLLPDHQMVNGVSWSLTNELFFYLAFAIFFFMPIKKKVLFAVLACLLAISFLFTLPGVANQYNLQQHRFLALLFFPMNIEFILGVLIALFVEQFPIKWCTSLLVTGVVLFIGFAFLSNKEMFIFQSPLNRVLYAGLPAFLIIMPLVKYELQSNISVPSMLLNLGNASYSIYLFHLPVVAAFFKIIVRMPFVSPLSAQFLSVVIVVAICISGVIFFRFIEEPMTKWLNKKLV